MRKILLFCLVVCALTSCKSNEEKAKELIEQYMFKNLFDYSSYEPIELKIDSAFKSIYRDSAVIQSAAMIKVARTKGNEALEKSKKARGYADIYADSYYSSGIRKYNEYMDEAKTELNNAQICLKMWVEHDSIINAIYSTFPREFIGWEVQHRFRSKNRGGNYTIGDYVFVLAPDYSKIIYQEDISDEDITEYKEIIDTAIKDE